MPALPCVGMLPFVLATAWWRVRSEAIGRGLAEETPGLFTMPFARLTDVPPDRGSELSLTEVNSSSNKLFEGQKRWIADNYQILRIPFRLLKVHERYVRG